MAKSDGQRDRSPMRVYNYTYPVQYKGSPSPDYWAVRTVYEVWNELSQRWDYSSHSEKLYHPSGHPVGG
jgi:hypothetical protein